MKRLSIIAHFRGKAVEVIGRDAWALSQLVQAGAMGCTPIDNPGPRWSGYVHHLRLAGFNIETVREAHKGRFPGTHARYILHGEVRIEYASEKVEAA